jgi:hypothetical protein
VLSAFFYKQAIAMTINPEQLLEHALKSGTEAAEVYASSSVSRPVFFAFSLFLPPPSGSFPQKRNPYVFFYIIVFSMFR